VSTQPSLPSSPIITEDARYLAVATTSRLGEISMVHDQCCCCSFR